MNNKAKYSSPIASSSQHSQFNRVSSPKVGSSWPDYSGPVKQQQFTPESPRKNPSKYHHHHNHRSQTKSFHHQQRQQQQRDLNQSGDLSFQFHQQQHQQQQHVAGIIHDCGLPPLSDDSSNCALIQESLVDSVCNTSHCDTFDDIYCNTNAAVSETDTVAYHQNYEYPPQITCNTSTNNNTGYYNNDIQQQQQQQQQQSPFYVYHHYNDNSPAAAALSSSSSLSYLYGSPVASSPSAASQYHQTPSPHHHNHQLYINPNSAGCSSTNSTNSSNSPMCYYPTSSPYHQSQMMYSTSQQQFYPLSHSESLAVPPPPPPPTTTTTTTTSTESNIAELSNNSTDQLLMNLNDHSYTQQQQQQQQQPPLGICSQSMLESGYKFHYSPNTLVQMGINPLTYDYGHSAITTYGGGGSGGAENSENTENSVPQIKDDSDGLDLDSELDLEERETEQLACYTCRGRVMCFCYFIKIGYFKFPSFFDLVEYQYKKWRRMTQRQERLFKQSQQQY
jgi:hypothetical protein